MNDRIALSFDRPPVAGRFTTLRLRITLAQELPVGAGLAVFWPYGFSLPQLNRPQFPGHVTAKAASGAALELSPLVINERSDHEYAVLLTSPGPLAAGEVLELVHGDPATGSPGARASTQAQGSMSVAVHRLDLHQSRHVPRLPESPAVVVEAGPAVAVCGFATPVLGRGEKGRLHLIAEDEYGNRDTRFSGRVRLLGIGGLAGLPAEVEFAGPDQGRKELEFRAERPGVHHPVVSGPGGDLEAGPVMVEARPPEYRLFFGELHCHTEHSSDGTGTLDELYGFARDTACLDFAAASDHMSFAANRPPEHGHAAAHLDYDLLPRAERWRATAEAARRHHRPGRFVTFLGTEADTVGHDGHRNVYFSTDDVAPVELPSWPPPPGFLAQWARGREVLVIPHHPPIWWGAGLHPGARGLNYGDLPEEVQPVVEIYSRHGTSEYLHNPRPLRGQIPGHFVQDMLAAGHHFGFIAGSDSHQANPGSSRTEGGPFKTLQYRSGLAAIWARELSRQAIWEAIFARRTFATSFPRFVLRFGVNDLFMGQAGAAPFPRSVRVWLASPAVINQVELLRNNEVIHIFSPSGHPLMPAEVEGELEFVDEKPSGRPEDCYYVRVTTRSGERAWASPVFARCG